MHGEEVKRGKGRSKKVLQHRFMRGDRVVHHTADLERVEVKEREKRAESSAARRRAARRCRRIGGGGEPRRRSTRRGCERQKCCPSEKDRPVCGI